MRLARILLLSTLTALVVVSCGGSDDVLDIPTPNPPIPPQPKEETPIAFSGDLSEGKSESHARTRATTNPLSATHQTFFAWAYKNPSSGSTETVMKNFTVKYVSNSAGSTTTNTQGWEYVNQQPANGTEQSVKYWDFSATAYRFFGYTGTGVTTSYSPDETVPTSVSLSFTASVATNPQADPVTLPLTASTPLYSKLWHKLGTDLAAESTQPVQLVFLQPYVKVRFLFKQSDSEEFVLTNKKFSPTNNTIIIATAGTFTVTYPMTGATEESWSVTGGTTTLTNADNDPIGFTVDNSWYVVLPAHAGNQGSYTLFVTVNGEDKTAIVPAQYMEWRPGYEYTYIFKITDGGTPVFYNVLAGFAQWDESESSHTVYNW
jgi:hypothetical protein